MVWSISGETWGVDGKEFETREETFLLFELN